MAAQGTGADNGNTAAAVGSAGKHAKALGAKAKKQWPPILEVSLADVFGALRAGWRDFLEAPLYGLALGGFYVVGGWLLILLLRYFDLPHLVYPLATGFALVAPFVVTGFYWVSRQLERAEPLSWAGVWGSLCAVCKRDMRWMALVTVFTLIIWLDIAALLFFSFFGLTTSNPAEILTTIFTTSHGLTFLALGNIAGAIIALAVFSFSAISFPMLFDRDIDFITAMVTSVKVVKKNKLVMICWAGIIALLFGLSVLTGLLGLLVVLPLLGHATWHIYRKSVGPMPEASSEA